MITYKDRMRGDLEDLNVWKFTIVQMREELETINAELTSIKATNFDKMPNGSGENYQEKKLVDAIAKKEELEELLALNERKVANIERLLNELSDEERTIIDRMIISKEMYAADRLVDELGYERRNIYRMRDNALRRLCQLRYGVAFHP